MKKLFYTALVFSLTVFFSLTTDSDANGQDVTASATVTGDVEITFLQNLTFSDIDQGDSDNVAPTSADNAGRWNVEAFNNATVGLSFDLPDEVGGTGFDYALVHTDEEVTGDDQYLQLSFSNTDATWDVGNNSESTVANAFDPTEGDTANFSESDSFVTVAIGGTVTATSTQVPGTYEGTITLTASVE